MNSFDEVKKREELGNRLKKAIKDSPYTQESFATACGISLQTLRTFLKGYSFYRVDILLKASRILGVSFEYLLCEEDYKIIPEKYLVERTHISEDAITKLIKLGNKYKEETFNNEMNNIIAIDEVINNESLLMAISNYLLFCRMKQINFNYRMSDKNSHEAWYFERIDKELTKIYGSISTKTLEKMYMFELISEFMELGKKKRR